MALYIGSDQPLPIVPASQYPKEVTSSPTWPDEAQRFHTTPLGSGQEAVRFHFTLPNILYAGSYEGCACGFNYGREYPQVEDDPRHLTAARESVAKLVRYVRDFHVLEIYSCWFDDEAKPHTLKRTVTPEELGSPEFHFREQELLTIEHSCK